MREEIYTMTQREITKLRVINQTIDGVLTIRDAAKLLNLSERQVIRLKKGVLQHGAAFVIHKNRGRKPSHTISKDVQDTIVELKRKKYQEANFNHFKELLEEHEHITVSYSTVHRILSRAGIMSPQKRRKPKAHHRRKRMPQKGMLVQIDASPYPWIIGGEVVSLHGAVDDATGEILALFFAKNECLNGYFQVMEQMITSHGIPISIYCDKHTIFVSPKKDKLAIEDQLQGKQVKLTQFGRAMEELGITVTTAHSPQAKGRIERLWRTLQSRLPIEFKLAGINTLEAANAFLAQFITKYNQRFGTAPENPNTAFRALDADLDLDTILCIKDERTIIEGGAFSYGGNYFKLVTKAKDFAPLPRARITVLKSPKTGIRAIYKGEVYETVLLEDRPKRPVPEQKAQTNRPAKTIPTADHPWRQIPIQKPKHYYGETDSEILAMLDELFSSTRAWA